MLTTELSVFKEPPYISYETITFNGIPLLRPISVFKIIQKEEQDVEREDDC